MEIPMRQMIAPFRNRVPNWATFLLLGLVHCALSWWCLSWFLSWAVGRSPRWPRYRIAALLVTALSVPTYALLSILHWSLRHWSLARSSFPEVVLILIGGVLCVAGWSFLLLVLLLEKRGTASDCLREC